MDVKNNTTERARQARNAYQREWRKKNPDKVKEIQLRHWAKKALELNEPITQKGETNHA